MSNLTLSPTFNKNKVFILNRSEIEKRLDPFYYVPELVELERKVLAKKPKKLRDYVVSLSSGATPKTTESEKYYTEKENGIPFLRVQNLSPTGVLEFEDCKYINKETHEGYLKRSQVFENDLLIKITGVGRMAVASVAPESFEGNINQHIVVIRTKDKQTSETLAAFLNSDIGEKLAARRSTGGTRPALDYPALLSIPILNDKRVLEITKRIVEQKKQNEAAAEKLLASIDDYLLKELGVALPTLPENVLKNRIFQVSINQVSGSRFDPLYHQGSIYGGLEKSKFKYKNFKEISKYFINGFAAGKQDQNIFAEGIIQIRPTNISDKKEFIFNKNIYIDLSRKNDLKNELLCKNEVLFNNTNSQELVGKTCVFNLEGDYFCSNHITRIGLHEEYISDYVGVILNLYQKNKVFYKSCINWNNQSGINLDILKTIKIPVPPFDKQKEIAEHITDIRTQAQQLKDKTKEVLKKASEEIEKILLR
ncbi:MAG: restriction endonuclease subunit S [Elusimicrobiota bacterium]